MLNNSPADPVTRRLRAELGGYVRQGNLDAAAAVRRKLVIHRLGSQIREAVASLPPLTPEDAAVLRGLLPLPLRGEDGSDAA